MKDRPSRIRFMDGIIRAMTHGEVCKLLGYAANSNFVKVTTGGTIEYTSGEPDEIHALYRAVRDNNLIPSKAFKKADALLNRKH